jgi:uracil DNA glycosylase
MNLVQVLLPLADNRGKRISHAAFIEVKNELSRRFGGVTAYVQSPAEGQWIDKGRKVLDEVITVEVMTDASHRKWWKRYKKALEEKFRQEQIVIRMHKIEIL